MKKEGGSRWPRRSRMIILELRILKSEHTVVQYMLQKIIIIQIL